MSIASGAPVLDELLKGGIPKNRALLVVGGPGTGKTTFGMQFLQEGLENGETCLFVSTEQTHDELEQSFSDFPFDLSHEHLHLVSLHATNGRTIENGQEPVLTLSTIDDEEEILPGEFSAPFEERYIQQYLERYAPCDRIVFDSVSGLAPLAENQDRFRKTLLEFIQDFTKQFGATTILTAEETNEKTSVPGVANSDLLKFSTHGVLRFWQESVDGTGHRYLRIVKMRGVNHTTQKHEIELTSDGVRVVPRSSTPSFPLSRQPMSTGIEGLDTLCDGGVLPGQPVVLEHDGRANVDPIVMSIACQAIRNDGAVVLFAPSHIGAELLDQILADRVGSPLDLLDNNQLFVVDWFDSWDIDHENIFPIHTGAVREFLLKSDAIRDRTLLKMYKDINQRRGDRNVVSIVYTETVLQDLEPETIRFQTHWVKSNILNEQDTLVVTHNPTVMEEKLAEFYVYDARQVFNLWRSEDGLQYIQVTKTPHGDVGTNRLVEQINEPPYVRIQKGPK